MIEMLAARGVYTLVDLHQDVLSPHLCGEGMPEWAFEKGLNLVGFDYTNPKKAFPHPLPYEIPLDSQGYPNSTVGYE